MRRTSPARLTAWTNGAWRSGHTSRRTTANFLAAGFYDASKYAGVSFKIKGQAKAFARFKLHDVNTIPEGGQCTKECWNAFGKTLQLTGEWQTFELSFAELHQLDGWGVPRPPSLTTSKVKHFEWAIDQGEAFDVWVDEVQLLRCATP